MKPLVPFLALILLAVSAPCGTPAASSAGEYGFNEPAPSEAVTVSGNVITVGQALGDRMFTSIESRYDARTLTLLSSKRRADCCGMYWNSTVTRNADGSYDIEAQAVPGPHDSEAYKESISHFRAQENAPIIAGSFFFIPWIYHVTHAAHVARVMFDPLRVEYLAISATSPSPFPDSVPTHDKALRISAGNQQTILWYDPCTFALDAFGGYDGAVVRRALLE